MVSVVEKLRLARVVPVIRHHDPMIARSACDLLIEAGVKAIEITTTVPDAPALIIDIRARFPDILIGAGTVYTALQADKVINAGASFVVSPCWSDAAARPVLAANLPYLPGAMTPGEVLHHSENGAALVKIFPADVAGGPAFLKALKSVFHWVELMPTGGITPQVARSYFDAGALCVGLGGNLLPAAALAANDTALARQQIRAALTTLSASTV